MFPGQYSQGLDEVVVSEDLSCHETTAIPKSSIADMAKSGNPVSKILSKIEIQRFQK